MREDHDDLKDRSGLHPTPPALRDFDNTAYPRVAQPEPTGEQRISDAIDATTKESVDQINGLIDQLQEMRAFVERDAERVKQEMLGHIAVRQKAKELTDNIRNQVDDMNARINP